VGEPAPGRRSGADVADRDAGFCVRLTVEHSFDRVASGPGLRGAAGNCLLSTLTTIPQS
jgi:hypothetical protein